MHASVSVACCAGAEVSVVLEETPFYAESGGQAADIGTLVGGAGGGADADPEVLLDVSDVQKAAGGRLFLHTATLRSGAVRVGQEVCVLVCVC
jgi:alanyl-tRNA synthetase